MFFIICGNQLRCPGNDAFLDTGFLQMGDTPAPAAGGRGGFSRGFGDRGGDRGRGDRGRGRGDRGRGRGRGKRDDEEAWVPCTKLGRLVQQGKVCNLHTSIPFTLVCI